MNTHCLEDKNSFFSKIHKGTSTCYLILNSFLCLEGQAVPCGSPCTPPSPSVCLCSPMYLSGDRVNASCSWSVATILRALQLFI